MATVGNIVKGTINANYKAIIEVLIKIYFKVIMSRGEVQSTSTSIIRLGM